MKRVVFINAFGCFLIFGMSFACTRPVDVEPFLFPCGDGHQEGIEECDDGNQEDGDGCSAVCRIEEKKDTEKSNENKDSGVNAG